MDHWAVDRGGQTENLGRKPADRGESVVGRHHPLVCAPHTKTAYPAERRATHAAEYWGEIRGLREVAQDKTKTFSELCGRQRRNTDCDKFNPPYRPEESADSDLVQSESPMRSRSRQRRNRSLFRSRPLPQAPSAFSSASPTEASTISMVRWAGQNGQERADHAGFG